MWGQTITSVGLVLDIIGAAILARGLIISQREAIDLGSSYIMGDTDEENLKIPPIRDRIRQSRNAKIGVSILIFGFVLQIVGAWALQIVGALTQAH